MDCLIELYDHEQLNNLVNIFAFRPKKVVFLYHSREVSYSSIQDIEKACRLKMPQIQVEAVKLDSLILDDITKGVKKVIWKNPNCAVDRSSSRVSIWSCCAKRAITTPCTAASLKRNPPCGSWKASSPSRQKKANASGQDSQSRFES